MKYFPTVLIIISTLTLTCALSPHANNQLLLALRRIRRSCQPAREQCTRHLNAEDDMNCLNQCISPSCYETFYGSEPVSFLPVSHSHPFLLWNK